MATLLNNSDVVNSLANIDPDLKSKGLAKVLSNNYYALRRHEITTSDARYGLIQIPAPQMKSWWQIGSLQSISIPGLNQTTGNTATDDNSKQKPDRSKLWNNLLFAAFTTVHVVIFVIFLYYRLTNNSTLFIKEGHYSPRTLLTLVSVLLGTYWSQLEDEARVMTPHRRLANSGTGSPHILNMSLHGVPIVTFFTALWHLNFFHACIAFICILSSCLTIAIVGIPYNFGVIQSVSIFSSTACLGMLVLMILTCGAVFFWRRTNPAMPRRPDTIASVITMLCASRMLEHFDGLDQDLNGWKHIKEKIYNQKYELMEMVGMDVKKRIMVEAVDAGSEQDAVVVKVTEVPPEPENVSYGHFQNEYERPQSNGANRSANSPFGDHHAIGRARSWSLTFVKTA